MRHLRIVFPRRLPRVNPRWRAAALLERDQASIARSVTTVFPRLRIPKISLFQAEMPGNLVALTRVSERDGRSDPTIDKEKGSS